MDTIILPKVGDILVGTWGYEACLATFVRVIEVKAATVRVVELSQIQTGDLQAGTAMPDLNGNRGTPKLKKVKNYDGDYYIKWDTCALGLWNGKPVNTYNHH